MPRRVSPQTRFLLRASLYFAALLAVWWFVLLPPLLAWVRISTDVVLNAIPGAPIQTGVDVRPGGIWVIQAPIRSGGRSRNVRLEAPQRLPTQLTIALPLFWAVILAAPRPRRLWRIIALGTAILLVLPPVGLLIYAAHVVRIYVYPNAPALVEYVLAVADYVASTVAPYVGPVLLALALHEELRTTVLTGETELQHTTGEPV
jgi:hypothetical protein